MFGAAGRLDWVSGWAYVGLYVLTSIVGAALVASRQPDLVDERAEAPEDAKTWDRWLSTILILLMLLGVPLVAALDARFRWTDVPLGLQIDGALVFVLGFALGMWAAASNPFYSRVVRIQRDRGHQVATEGPYRFVRHPGYVGSILNMVGMSLLLDSLWALALSGVSIVLLVLRTHLEDRTLQQELDGYSAYARVVRYRLLPGVW